MDREPTAERLAQQLRDERRLRDAAEQKASKQATNARKWRERAEERAERIERLVAERERLTRLPHRLRAITSRAMKDSRKPEGPSAQTARSSAAPSPSEGPPQRHLAQVQIGHLSTSPELERVLDQCTRHDLTTDPSGLFEGDLIVLEEEAYQQAPADVRERIREWLILDARQPCVWIGSDLPEEAQSGPTLPVVPGSSALPHTFDPVTDTPIGRDGSGSSRSPTVDDRDQEGVNRWDPRDPAQLARAARAVPVVGTTDPVREGDRRRRYVWTHHTPAAAARGMVRAAGVSIEEANDTVAAILVSNRPDDLDDQVRAITSQGHPKLQIRVGCHGFSSAMVSDAIDEVAGRFPVTVLDLPSSRELGWCLNRVIEGSGAPVLAKIDDDDHYGPGYLIDALQALDYSRADLIGRVCSFTYLEGEDRTVLRRLGDEERYYDGTLIGATMVFRRSAWERAPFAHKTLAEDVSFQRGVRSTGGQVYVASRWDFVYRRRVSGNTWRAPDEHFLSHAEDAWEGWEPTRANLEAS